MTAQKRHWVFTINPKHVGLDDDCSETEIVDAYQHYWQTLEDLPNLRYICGQVEVANTGRIHINGYVEYSVSYRKQEVLRNLRAHVEPRKGSRDEARKYCRSTIYKGKNKGRIVLLPEYGEWRVEKASAVSPKQRALLMLKQGFSPSDILQNDPDVYFTHYRAIEATYGLMVKAGIILSTAGEEE